MRKIPTVFARDPDDMRRFLSPPAVVPGCEWVLAGEGTPTRKYDGTCVLLDGRGEWWARREVKRGKAAPPGFVAAESDRATGKTVGWEPIGQSGFAKWHAEALSSARPHEPEELARARVGIPGTYELCGPKVNGNPEGLDSHSLIRHASAEAVDHWSGTYTFAMLRDLVLLLGEWGWEGVVWHHPDGRMAKLKARDFGARATKREEVQQS